MKKTYEMVRDEYFALCEKEAEVSRRLIAENGDASEIYELQEEEDMLLTSYAESGVISYGDAAHIIMDWEEFRHPGSTANW